MASTTQVVVPDIGGFKDVEVIDVLVKAGQEIDKETPMVTLETEKAAMDVPSPAAGRIAEVKVKKGDKVSEGSVILVLESAAQSPAEKPAAREGAAGKEEAPASAAAKTETPAADKTSDEAATEASPPQAPASQSSAPPRAADDSKRTSAASSPPSAGASPIDEKAFSTAYASPSVRKFARELGADLGQVKGTGPKGRITHEDVKAYVKKLLSAATGRRRWSAEGTRSRLRAVRRGGVPTALANPAHLRRAPAGELDQPASCHAA